MTAPVEIGRLRVRPGPLRVGPGGMRSSSLGRDVVARLRAEALLDGLRPAPGSVPERGVLVIRQARWPADEMFTTRARAELDERRRTARRPALTPGRGEHEDAVVFDDEVELLACLTSDAVSGQLSRWYWRRLVPTTTPGTGPVLAAAWTSRARWLPPALATLPTGVVTRAVESLTDREAAQVTQALLVAFDVGAAAASVVEVATGLSERAPTRAPAAVSPPPVAARSGSPRAPRLAPSGVGHAEPRRLLLEWAHALFAHPEVARREGIARAAAAVGDLGAGRADRPHRVGPARAAPASGAEGEGTAGPRSPSGFPARSATSPDGVVGTPSPAATHRSEPEPVAVTRGQYAPADADIITRADPAEEPADPTPFAGAVPSACASVLFVVNLAQWLELPGGWSAVQRLARLVLAPVLIDPSRGPELAADPVWALLGDLAAARSAAGSAAGSTAGSAAAGRPVTPWPSEVTQRLWDWLGSQNVTADVFTRPGLVAVTATHVDVVLDLDQVDLAARVSGLDRDPGWVPDLARIISFHFVGGRVHRFGTSR